MKNNKWINQSKGIAILLVVLGHTILGFQSAYMFSEYDNIFNYLVFTIYSFHMPLFFIISGYIYYKFEKVGNSQEYRRLIKKKSLNLLIPYFVFGSIQLLIKIVLSGTTNGETTLRDIYMLPIVPQEQFWFLYTLFFIFVILTFVDMKFKNKIKVLSVLIILNMLEIHIKNGIFAITSFCVYGVYFYIGILFAKRKITKNIAVNRKVVSLSMVILYVITNIFIYKYDNNINIERLLALILAILGSFVVISITQWKINNKFFALLGRYSFEIFLLHTIFGSGIRILLIKVFNIQNIFIHFSIGILFSLALPIFIAKIGRKIKLIDFLFKPSKYCNFDCYIKK